MKKSILQNVAFCLVALAFLLLTWQIACALLQNEYLLPSAWESIQTAFSIMEKGEFWTAFFATFLRCFCAFVISFVFAVIFALVAYLLPLFSKFFTPIVSMLRSLPTMAIILILLILTTPLQAPVIVAFLTLFPMLYTSVYSALCDVDESLIQMSKIYRVPLKRQIFSLYLPALAPKLALESGAALSHSLKVVVSAEILSHTYQSLGGWMQDASLYVEMPKLFALVLIVFFTGLLIELFGNTLFYLLQRRVK